MSGESFFKPGSLTRGETSYTAQLVSVDRDIARVFFGDPHPAPPEPLHTDVAVVFEQEVEWAGPQRPVLRGNRLMRVLRGPAHLRRVAEWRRRREAWEAAGRPKMTRRTVIPRAVITSVQHDV